jgi:hypothetical protein
MSGSMFAQNVGGGTANMEFEALTGMSASGFPAQLRVPYQMIVPNYASFPSAVRWAKDTGHKAVALHPFSTEMYRRREVYSTFGFDRFIYDQTMHRTLRIGHGAYISDESAFAEVRRELRNERKPVFMNVVTMQNHMPYAGRYDDPVKVTADGAPLSDAGQYARGLEHTDAALRRMVGWLQRLPEPTVMVLYGDHLPGFYPRGVFDANGPLAMHRTRFFVFANFPDRAPHASGRTAAPALVSPAHFMDLAAERAGVTEEAGPGLGERRALRPGRTPHPTGPAVPPGGPPARRLPARAVRPVGREAVQRGRPVRGPARVLSDPARPPVRCDAGPAAAPRAAAGPGRAAAAGSSWWPGTPARSPAPGRAAPRSSPPPRSREGRHRR